MLALIALLVPASSAFAQGDEPDDPPAAAPAPADDDPPAAAPAAADDDDDKPGAPPAAAGDADGDGTPDAPAAAAAGDADGDGTPDAPPAADADGDGKPDAPAADADGDGKPDAPAADTDGDGKPDAPPAADADGDGQPDAPAALAVDTDPGPRDTSDDSGAFDPSDDAAEAAADDATDVAVTEDEDGEPYIEADADGDGVVSADELAGEQEFDTAFADIPDQVSDDALDARPENAELMPSIGIDQFRQLVRLAKRKVLERLEAKIAKKADARMKKIALYVSLFSLAGLLLLAMPLVLARRYPGQMGALFKYSAIAALTFVVTVNLFGGIMLGMRSVQSAVGSQTNPQLRLAAGFFDTLDHNAARYVVTGREVFAPTLEALNGKSDEQPAAVLIANGQKVVEKATVFKQVAGMFQKVSFIFGALPIVLLAVTMILFVVAIKPTLMEIINLPATAAAGAAGASSGVVKRAMRRVGGELVATICTLGVLIVLSLLAGFVMGRVVEPMLDTLITCFARALDYLQFVEDASPTKVGLMLFSVILALVFNLAVVILSMSFFLGKTQKIFQQRFNQGVPLAAHARWWKWGVPSVVFALLLPLVYLAVAKLAVGALERKIMASVTDAEKVNWSALLLATPGLLVVGFVVFLWAARGVKALGFLASYKVKLAVPPPPAPAPLA